MILKEINPRAAVLPLEVTPSLEGTIMIQEKASQEADDVLVDASIKPDPQSNMSIQQDQNFEVIFNWKWQSGRFLDDSLAGGKWRCAALFEAMGSSVADDNPAEDFNKTGSILFGDRKDTVSLPTPNGAIPREYTLKIPINQELDIKTGLYRVSARAQYFDKNGKGGMISFFEDLGMIHIYSDSSSFV